MKVALIGCGAWGKNLARVFNEIGVLGMVCDPVTPRLPFEVRHERTLESALGNKEITAVAIASPAADHAWMATAAIACGKDVFVEKPMAHRWIDARQMVEVATNHSRVLMVGHIVEYTPAIIVMRGMIKERRIGEISNIKCARLQLGKVREGESALWSLAPHDVAMVLRFMRSEPDKVEAYGTRDTVTVYLSFPSGKTAEIAVSWESLDKLHSIIIEGDHGALHHESKTGGREVAVDLYRKNDFPSFEKIRIDKNIEPLMVECEAFVSSCLERRQPLSDGVSGAAVVRVLELADQSLNAKPALKTG